MHKSLKYAIAAGVGVGALEFVYTTTWYQQSSFFQAGAVSGIAFDVAVAGSVAALVALVID